MASERRIFFKGRKRPIASERRTFFLKGICDASGQEKKISKALRVEFLKREIVTHGLSKR